MAITNATVWELRTTSDAKNGGGFNQSLSVNGVDYTQQDAPEYVHTKILSTSLPGSVTLLRSAGTWSEDVIGNCIQITAGLNFVLGIYQILARPTTTSLTLDRSPTPGGGGTSGSGNIGGALDDPTTLTSLLTAGNRIWCKAGTYVLSKAWTLPESIASVNAKIRWTGYSTIRGDAIKPVAYFDGNSAAREVLKIGTSSTLYGHYIFEFIAWKEAGGTYAAIDAKCRNNIFWRCGVYDTNFHGFGLYAYGNVCVGCEAYNFGFGGATSYGFRLYTNSAIIGCYAHAPTSLVRIGFLAYHGATVTRCVARNLYRGIYAYMSSAAYQGFLINCAAYGCSTDGFYVVGNLGMLNLINCIAVNNSGYGLNDAHSTGATINVSNFAHYGNGSGGIDSAGPSEIISLGGLSEIALTEQPFMNPTAHDFRIKSHLSALLRAGFPENLLANGDINKDIPYGLDFGPMESPWRGRRT